MLQFVCGTAATGKTYTVMQKIINDVKLDKKAVLIVPEQFSFESEKAVLEILGDKLANLVDVLSFNGLADKMVKEYGGVPDVLSDSQKILFMMKTLKALKDSIPLWRKYVSSNKFASKVVDMIGEFKVSAVTYEDLENASEFIESNILKTKLSSLAKIWRAYDALINNRFIDPADKLTVLYNQLLNNDIFKNKNVYIDSFKGFTGQQKKIIERILVTADNLTVTGLCDNKENQELDMFYNTRKTLMTILNLAKKHGIKVLPDIVLNKAHYDSEEMTELEKMFSENENSVCENKSDNIILCSADSASNEAVFAAMQIKRLVRERNYRYRDFAVIVRNSDIYEAYLESEFLKNGIPMFYDKRISLKSSPVYRFISSAIKASSALSSSDILAFVKTRLVEGFDDDDINLLENYVFLWNIESSLWTKEWNMDPEGFVAKEKDENEQEEDKKFLIKINKLRQKAIKPILTLKKELSGSTENMASAIFNLIKNCKADILMKNFLLNLPEEISAEDIDSFRQSYDKIIEILDDTVRCFKDENISVKDFINAFETSCEMTTVGRIPQLVDEVTFSDAERICPSDFKYIFVLGANQGVFPAEISNNSLIGNSERRKLIDAGFEIKDKTLFFSIEENLLVYSTLCSARNGVCITMNTAGDGGKNEPSSFYTSISNKFSNVLKVNFPKDLLKENVLPESVDSAFDFLCKIGSDTAQSAALKKILLDNKDLKEKYSRAVAPFADSDISLTEETAKKLYGECINSSATRFDTYFRCPFSYFCRYGLKTVKFQSASLDVMQRGTLVHYVLEQFCNRHLENIAFVEKETADREVIEFTNKYLSLIKGSESLKSPYFVFLLNKITDGIKDVIYRIIKEFAQSKFKPVCCEVTIGKDGVIEPVDFKFENGRVRLYGSIDRMDTFGNYVRIVDYKTGTKKFKISDTLYGQNMQMLLYLYAVVRGKNKELNSKKPAGILYLPSKLDIKKEGLAMNGLISDDINIISAMDNAMAGEFIPEFKINKDGTPSKKNTSFISGEDFDVIFDYIEKLSAEMGRNLLSGNISVCPVDTESDACKYCDYKAVCGIEDKEHSKAGKFTNNEVFEIMRGETSEV